MLILKTFDPNNNCSKCVYLLHEMLDDVRCCMLDKLLKLETSVSKDVKMSLLYVALPHFNNIV